MEANESSYPEEPEYCNRCNLTFTSLKDLQVHKLGSNKHIVCNVCCQEFQTEQGLKRHYNLLHSAKQDLYCPGCTQHFTRVGGLIGHIELRQCPVISVQDFKNALDTKQKFQRELEDARMSAEYGVKFKDDVEENKAEPLQYEADPIPIRDNWTEAGSLDGRPMTPNQSFADAFDDDEDLLIFESPVKRDGWEDADDPKSPTIKPLPKIDFGTSSSKAKTAFDNLKDFPALPKTQNRDVFSTGDEKATGWVNTQEASRFHRGAPSARLQAITNQWPAPVKPVPSVSLKAVTSQAPTPVNPVPSGSLKAAIKQSPPPDKQEPSTEWQISTDQAPTPAQPYRNPEYLAHDPDAPDFNVRRYWNDFLRKYQCPHAGCTKSVATPGGFKQHLKSAAHYDLRLRCQGCLRYFANATALTQHSEAQGVRCTVRHTSNYSSVVDKFTAGTTATAGRHDDNTVRYVTNQIDLRKGAELFAQAHREEQARAEEAFLSYWDNRHPDW